MHPLAPDGRPMYSRAVPCSCRHEAIQRERYDRLLLRCQIPAKYTAESLDDYRPGTPSEGDALMAARLLAAEHGKAAPARWLTLVGGVERGKTMLAVGICKEWMQEGTPAWYTYVPKILDRLRNGYEASGAEGYERLLDDLCTIPLLILDDLGVETASAWAVEKLNTIVNDRYNTGLALVVTTNLPLTKLPPRIASRLQRYKPGAVCLLDGPEYRLRTAGG